MNFIYALIICSSAHVCEPINVYPSVDHCASAAEDVVLDNETYSCLKIEHNPFANWLPPAAWSRGGFGGYTFR